MIYPYKDVEGVESAHTFFRWLQGFGGPKFHDFTFPWSNIQVPRPIRVNFVLFMKQNYVTMITLETSWQ